MGYQLRGPPMAVWGKINVEDGKVKRWLFLKWSVLSLFWLFVFEFVDFSQRIVQTDSAEGWIMICLLHYYHVWSELTCGGDDTQPIHYWLFGWKFCSWGWDIRNLVITGPGMKPYWQSMEIGSHHILAFTSIFDLTLKVVVLKIDPEAHVILHRFYRKWSVLGCKLFSAPATYSQVSFGATSANPRCSCGVLASDVLGRKVILYSGTLNSFVDTFCYCSCCFAITPNQVDSMSNRYTLLLRWTIF